MSGSIEFWLWAQPDHPKPGSPPRHSITLPPWPHCPQGPSPWRISHCGRADMTHGMVAMVWDRGWTPSSCQDLEQGWDSTGCAWAVSLGCSPSLNSASGTAHELGGQTHSRDKPTAGTNPQGHCPSCPQAPSAPAPLISTAHYDVSGACAGPRPRPCPNAGGGSFS